MKNPFLYILSCLLGFVCLTSFAQQLDEVAKSKDLVQFSGVIMAADSLSPVLYANVYIKNTIRGTVSNAQGFFSFVVKKGDTINVSAIGFQKAELIIPTDIEGNTYSILQFMRQDTIMLPEALIYPWPTREEFKHAFLRTEIPDDDLQRARRNLDREKLREIGEVLAMDGRENYKVQMQHHSRKLYHAGQYAPMQIFNPFAWVEFFKALKRGDFKNKNKKKRKKTNN